MQNTVMHKYNGNRQVIKTRLAMILERSVLRFINGFSDAVFFIISCSSYILICATFDLEIEPSPGPSFILTDRNYILTVLCKSLRLLRGADNFHVHHF